MDLLAKAIIVLMTRPEPPTLHLELVEALELYVGPYFWTLYWTIMREKNVYVPPE